VGDKIMATSLKSAIAEYVSGMKAAGVVINTNAAAIILASKYPKSGLPMQDVVREIEEETNRLLPPPSSRRSITVSNVSSGTSGSAP
jgi:hypothetical protein